MVASRNCPHPSGFTLVEMLVALAVFSLAALALIRLEGAVIRNTAALDEAMLAQIVAHNVAAEAISDARAPAAGEARGEEMNGGRRWAWTRKTAILGDKGAVRLDIAVANARGMVRGQLSVVRPPNPPPRPAAQNGAPPAAVEGQ